MSLRHVLAAASIVIASCAFAACSNQAEGDCCDIDNNNDDCQEGLVCKSKNELGGSADICCPEGTSELPECTPGGGATSTSGATTTTAVAATTTADTSSSTSTGQGGGDGGASSQGGGGSSSDGGGGASSQGGGGAGGN